MRASLFAFVATLAFLHGERAARADSQWALQTSADVRDFWFRSMPQYPLSSYSTGLRTVQGTLPSTGSQHFAALTVDTGAVVNGRWMIPGFGFQFGWAVGTSPTVVTGVEGSIVEMQAASSWFMTLLLPGVGVRGRAGRWMFEAAVRPVITAIEMDSLGVASGATSVRPSDSDTSTTPSPDAVAFGLRGELEACRMLDPMQRVCLLASPALSEFSAMNGGSVGLRWEWDLR